MPKSLSGHELLPPSPLLTLTTVERNEAGWIVKARGPDQATCPRCRQVSTSRHSRYVRSLKDLPAVGAAVSLRVQVSRWRCRQPACAVRFFTGVLTGVAGVRGRRTCRADVVTHLVGHALGGRPGERLVGRLGLRVSDDTILRGLKTRARAATTGAPVIGIDEWAKRKGVTYGTIVVDLEQRTVIDVLGTHTTEAVEQWLVTHPEIRTICRDRNGRYAKAARTGAPTARQVADRFHLVQNLRDTIERELSMQRAHLRVEVGATVGPLSSPLAPAIEGARLPVCVSGNPRERRLLPARRLAIDTEIARQRREEQQALFERVKGLQATGLPMIAIAQQLGCNRRRFDRWGKVDELPARRMMPPRRGSVATFRAYLRQRWNAGYRNGRMLFDEIRALGYVGTYTPLHKLLSPWRLGNVAFENDGQLSPSVTRAVTPLSDATSTPLPPLQPDVTARQIAPHIAAALLAKPRPELTPRQAEIVDGLKAHCPGYAVMRSLMLAFRSILRHPAIPSKTVRTTVALHRWLNRAEASGIGVIQSLVGQLRRDVLAVEAAVTTRWSNGPVEGQVNRLKMLKRQMYGRAGVELLRARLIPLPIELTTEQRE